MPAVFGRRPTIRSSRRLCLRAFGPPAEPRLNGGVAQDDRHTPRRRVAPLGGARNARCKRTCRIPTCCSRSPQSCLLRGNRGHRRGRRMVAVSRPWRQRSLRRPPRLASCAPSSRWLVPLLRCRSPLEVGLQCKRKLQSAFECPRRVSHRLPHQHHEPQVCPVLRQRLRNGTTLSAQPSAFVLSHRPRVRERALLAHISCAGVFASASSGRICTAPQPPESYRQRAGWRFRASATRCRSRRGSLSLRSMHRCNLILYRDFRSSQERCVFFSLGDGISCAGVK